MTDVETAADAFDVLSDPSRVAILRELASRFYEHDGRPVGFADLRRAVGIGDPGRFNYHLDKLCDRFVVKREGGYTPTVAGLKAVESAEAGVYVDDTEPVAGPVDYDCPECDELLTATYENHWVTVSCDEHGPLFKTLIHGSTSTDRGIEEVVRYAVGEMWRRVDRATDGVCPICRGSSLSIDFRGTENAIVADCACGNCYYEETNPAVLFALAHPAALSLFHERGIDVRRRLPFESLRDWIDDARLVDDGRAVEIRATAGEEAVTLRIADDLTVETV